MLKLPSDRSLENPRIHCIRFDFFLKKKIQTPYLIFRIPNPSRSWYPQLLRCFSVRVERIDQAMDRRDLQGVALLPEGVLCRVPPRGLAACRVRLQGIARRVVDDRHLLPADLLPLSVDGLSSSTSTTTTSSPSSLCPSRTALHPGSAPGIGPSSGCPIPLNSRPLSSAVNSAVNCIVNIIANVKLNNLIISKLRILKLSFPKAPIFSMEIFDYVNKMDSYPNVSISYRILLIISVMVAQEIFRC